MDFDRIRQLADISIRRGCGFGLIAIATAAVGVSSDAYLAMRLAAICATSMAAILAVKAMQAPSRNYRRTEVYIMLEGKPSLPDGRAQRVFGEILRERYIWHATVTAAGAVVLWLVVFLLFILGRYHPW